MRDVAELYEPLAEEKGLVLKVETSGMAPVMGSRELISQALANLIDNAIKYAGPDPAKARVRRWAERHPDIVVSTRSRASGFARRSPIKDRAFRRRTAGGWSNGSCGSNRVVRCPASVLV